MTTALYPGSFDPLHRGHLAVIEQAARTFDSVVVGVIANPAKPPGLFAVDERVKLIEAATSHLPSVRCVAHHGLTVDLARAVGAGVLVRSAHKELAQERAMAATNELVAGVRTFFATPDPATRAVSSTLVRTLVAGGEHDAAMALVPAAVAAAIAARREPQP